MHHGILVRSALGLALELVFVLAASPRGAGTVFGGEFAEGGKQLDPEVYRIEGGGELGERLVVVGDVDRDGVKDFAATQEHFVPPEPGDPRRTNYNLGEVNLYSGKDGRVLRTWIGENKLDSLGTTGLFVFPDLDEDGVLELGMRAIFVGVHVVSPVTGARWHTIDDPGGTGWYQELAILPDIDMDGVGECLAGSPGAAPVPYFHGMGRIRCFSGRSLALLWTRWGTQPSALLGQKMCVSGDHDGDGFPDVLCTEAVPDAPRSDRAKYQEHDSVIRVLSGRTGATIATLAPPGPLHFGFGQEIVSLGDRDGDGFPEVAVSAPFYRPQDLPGWSPLEENLRYVGWVGVYRLPGFELLFSQTGRDPHYNTLPSGDQFGITLAPAGDVDGDGITDLAAGTDRTRGASDYAYGRIYVISGADGHTLAVYEGLEPFEPFCHLLSPLDDVDGDGRDELIAVNFEEMLILDNGLESTSEGVIRVLTYHPEAPRFIRGDANGDGRVTVTDAVTIITRTSREICAPWSPPPEPRPGCLAAWDVNTNGCLSHADAVALLAYLFERGVGLPNMAPYPDCAAYYRLQVDGDLLPYNVDCRDGGSCGPE